MVKCFKPDISDYDEKSHINSLPYAELLQSLYLFKHAQLQVYSSIAGLGNAMYFFLLMVSMQLEYYFQTVMTVTPPMRTTLTTSASLVSALQFFP